MNRVIKPIAISSVYLAAVLISYLLDLHLVLNVLSLPFNIPLLLLSGLILHVASNGREVLAFGKVVAAIINVVIYLWLTFRRP